jgi:hypothetical protein
MKKVTKKKKIYKKRIPLPQKPPKVEQPETLYKRTEEKLRTRNLLNEHFQETL